MHINKSRNFVRCESGTAAIIIAVALGMLLIIVGMVLDVGRMYAVQSKAQNAADAALLGAVATRDVDDISTEMTNLFNANYPTNYLGSTVSIIAVSQVSPGVYQAQFQVTLPALMPSTILNDGPQVFNILSQVTVGLPNTQNAQLELSLVLDNTGSMSNSLGSGQSKIAALQSASSDLVDILFGGSSTLDNLHISVVPYNIVVQIGTGHDGWMQTYPADDGQFLTPVSGAATNNTNSLPKYQALTSGALSGGKAKGFAGNRETDFFCGPYGVPVTHPPVTCPTPPPPPVCWDCTGFVPVCTTTKTCDAETGDCTTSSRCTTCTPGCHAACTPRGSYTSPPNDYTCYENGLNDVDDTPPTSAPYLFRLPYENNITSSDEYPGQGWPGSVDDHTWTSTLAPLLFDSNVKTDLHNALTAMQAGGDTRIDVGLMWGWFTLSPKWQGLWDSAKPSLPATPSATLSKVIVLMTDGLNDLKGNEDNKTLAMCAAIKANGITIYTVGLGEPGALNESLLQQCATKPTYYFNAPTTDQLKTIFHQIGDTVSSDLTERLSQ